MDWENERYVRLYIRDTADMLAIGWEGRALFAEILRKVDRAGFFDSDEPEVIAELVRMPHDVVGRALPKLIDRGMVIRSGSVLLIPAFLDAQEAKSSDKQRSKESRARRRDQAKAQSLEKTANVTTRDDTATIRDDTATIRDQHPGVTVENVTPSLAVPSLAKNIHVGTLGPDGVVSSKKESKPEPSKAKTPPELALRSADYLRNHIIRIDPAHKLAKTFPTSTRNRWATTLDQTHRIDGRSWESIREVIEWLHRVPVGSPQAGGFVIFSANGLREKFDKVRVRMKATAPPGSGLPPGKPAPSMDERSEAEGLTTEEWEQMMAKRVAKFDE